MKNMYAALLSMGMLLGASSPSIAADNSGPDDQPGVESWWTLLFGSSEAASTGSYSENPFNQPPLGQLPTPPPPPPGSPGVGGGGWVGSCNNTLLGRTECHQN